MRETNYDDDAGDNGSVNSNISEDTVVDGADNDDSSIESVLNDRLY